MKAKLAVAIALVLFAHADYKQHMHLQSTNVAASIYPPPSLFRFADSVIGPRACLPSAPSVCYSFLRQYQSGQTAGNVTLNHDTYLFAVKPSGVVAPHVAASYQVELYNNSSDAGLSEGNSITMAPKSLFVDEWLLVGNEQDNADMQSGYASTQRTCSFASVRTYRNLTLAVYVKAYPVTPPCRHTRQWILRADTAIDHALAAYVARPEPDEQG